VTNGDERFGQKPRQVPAVTDGVGGSECNVELVERGGEQVAVLNLESKAAKEKATVGRR
jgi:hypothetical protein